MTHIAAIRACFSQPGPHLPVIPAHRQRSQPIDTPILQAGATYQLLLTVPLPRTTPSPLTIVPHHTGPYVPNFAIFQLSITRLTLDPLRQVAPRCVALHLALSCSRPRGH